jgi:uroporphyrin-III C-methyltransferase
MNDSGTQVTEPTASAPPVVRTPPRAVTLVGTGPGAPDLLTLRAARLIGEAEVAVYDRLVGRAILDLLPPGVEHIAVGKAKGRHSVTQADINRILVARARQGLRVVRLKGGDPYVFGRGGEEAEFLARHGIPVDVVPGVTAAIGCAAAASVPLTFRGVSDGVTFVTGHGSDGLPDQDWAALARGRYTIAVYMGMSVAGYVAERLIEHGMPVDTPCAVVENGTLAGQKTVTGVLADLQRLSVENGLAAPAMIFIGDAVARRPYVRATRDRVAQADDVEMVS